MKKHKRTLFSLNKTKISNLNHLSSILGGGDTDGTNHCETYDVDACLCEETASCIPESSAFVPPTGGMSAIVTMTNGAPGNTCC